MFSKAREKAAEGVGSLSNLGASSLGLAATSLTSSAASWSSSSASSLGSAVGQLQVGSRAAAATQRVKELMSSAPKSNLLVGSLPTALVPDQRVDYAIILPPKHRGSGE